MSRFTRCDLGADIEELTLESQFRCDGSKGYIAWLDDVLEIRETANADGFDQQIEPRTYSSLHPRRIQFEPYTR